MQYSSQHSLHVMALTRSLLHSSAPSLRPSCCQVMPPLCPISLPSFLGRSLRGRLHAHFLCNVGDSQPKQKQPTLLRPPLPLPLSLLYLIFLVVMRMRSTRGERGGGGGAPYHHPSAAAADLVDLADRPTVHRQQPARKTSIARTHDRAHTGGRTAFSCYLDHPTCSSS